MIKTGDIWLAQLDPTIGNEIQKIRPCVVISSDELNAHLRTLIVVLMTTGSRLARFRVPLTFQGKQGLIVLDQIRRARSWAPGQAAGGAAGTHAGGMIAATTTALAPHSVPRLGLLAPAGPASRDRGRHHQKHNLKQPTDPRTRDR